MEEDGEKVGTQETEEQRKERLSRFVMDYCDGKIFTSLGLEGDEVMSSFMVLVLADKDIVPKDTAIVWEYISEAGPRSINGRPCFFSCRFMSISDAERVLPAIRKEFERRNKPIDL